MYKLFKLIFVLALTLTITMFNVISTEAAKKVVAVMPIEYSSVDETAKEVANIMENQITRALLESNTYTIVERAQLNHAFREMGFQMTGAVDPNQTIKVGKMLGVQYSVISKVTVAELKNNQDKIILGTIIGIGTGSEMPKMSKFAAKIALDIKFINNETGEIMLMTQVSGEKGGDSKESVLNEVCKAAADDLFKQIQQKNPFTATVLEVYDNEIYIDAGIEAGLHEGDILEILKEGIPITNMEGKIIAVRTTILGKLKVISVNSGYSICQIIERTNTGAIKRGVTAKRISY